MTAGSAALALEEILSPIQEPMKTVEILLLKRLGSDVPLLSQVGQHILRAGGKRIRPALVLLAAGTVGRVDQQTCEAACIIEYLHTATLLHDDVVDNAELRRSKKTARTIWGNEASVLVGDYLLGTAYQMLSELNDLRLFNLISDTATQMAKGELLQLSRDNLDTDEAEYLKIIYSKTASLMGAAMQMGAILGEAEPVLQKQLFDCGISFGMAFQLVDDALDYDLGNAELGKLIGTDLKERKITLPLSYLLTNAVDEHREEVTAILDGDWITDEHVKRVCGLMADYDAFAYTIDRARSYIEQAREDLSGVPENAYRRSIEQLTAFIVSRRQ